MSDPTRERLLQAARQQFAEKGFYGASLAQVAGSVGLTKQVLLYHFKRKEDLYRAVLEKVTARLSEFVETTLARNDAPAQQMENIMLGLYDTARDHPEDTRLLMRELLDNAARAESARDWYLKPFLNEIVRILKRVPGYEDVPFAQAFCTVYQLLGSIEYFSISTPTLQRMYGEGTHASCRQHFPMELRRLVRRVLAREPS